MRDIRGDLQERAIFVDEQIRAAAAHFDKAIQQLQTERDARIADLKAGLAQWQAGDRSKNLRISPARRSSLHGQRAAELFGRVLKSNPAFLGLATITPRP